MDNEDGSYSVTTIQSERRYAVSSTFNYNSAGELVDGEETVNGKTVRYSGPNFTVIAETNVIDLDSAAFETIVLDDEQVPSQFKEFMAAVAGEADVIYRETIGSIADDGLWTMSTSLIMQLILLPMK